MTPPPKGSSYDYANTQVGERITILPDVSQIAIQGAQSAIRIKADPSRMAVCNISLDDLTTAIKNGTSYTGAGQFDGAHRTYLLQPQGQLLTADENNNLIVGQSNDAPIYLKDVATAREGLKDERMNIRFWARNLPQQPGAAVVVAVFRRAGSNAVEVSRSVRNFAVKPQEGEPVCLCNRRSISEPRFSRGSPRSGCWPSASGAFRVGWARQLSTWQIGVVRRTLKRAKRWHLVGIDLKPPKEPRSIERAMTLDKKLRLPRLAGSDADWQTARRAATLALNTTMRGCEIKQLRWRDIDLIGRTLAIRKSKTDAEERTIPLRERAKGISGAEPQHFVFASCENGHIDPDSPQKSWRTAWRRLTAAIECTKCRNNKILEMYVGTVTARRTLERSKAQRLGLPRSPAPCNHGACRIPGQR